MNDPFWKRSGFGAAILATVALCLRWALDGSVPTSDTALEVVAMWVTLLVYQKVRPTAKTPPAA